MPAVQRALLPIRLDKAPLMGASRPSAIGIVVRRRPDENALSSKMRSNANGMRKNSANRMMLANRLTRLPDANDHFRNSASGTSGSGERRSQTMRAASKAMPATALPITPGDVSPQEPT